MTGRAPRFLNEEDGGVTPSSSASTTPSDMHPAATPTPEPPSLPRGPVLLEPEADASDTIELDWTPETVPAPPVRVGTLTWVAAGLAILLLSWALLSLASFVVALMLQSLVLGLLGAAGVGLGLALLLWAGLVELRAFRSLGRVERLRRLLAAEDSGLEDARRHALAWLHQLGQAIPRRADAERSLRAAGTMVELQAVLRSQIADRLQEAAGAIGRRAALEGATLVAICPHPAWDAVLAGGRGLLVIRRVAALYGLRPGLAVTLALMRRVAWTAAGVAGLDLVSQGVADRLLGSMPVLKHVVGALPGSGVVAARLYRLAGIAAEACSPVPSKS